MKFLSLVVAIGTLSTYAASGFYGWGASDVHHEKLPASARIPPGGHVSPGSPSSYHFWHTGFHGGK
jgi:hypothetical protein